LRFDSRLDGSIEHPAVTSRTSEMATNRALLIAARERLEAWGGQVPARAESFHRERLGLLAELDAALSWRGRLGLGLSLVQGAPGLVPRADALEIRAQALHDLFGQIGQIEDQLSAAAQTLERIAAPRLRDPGAIPAVLEGLRAEVRRLGRQVRTDDDLMVDQGRCADARIESARLGEALTLWLSAESALATVRVATRTAPLEAALPDLAERLCRAGPTPEWRTELKALVDPLEQLANRAQPREITETEKIIKALPRWARVLGEACEDCVALSERFKARRKDWPGEDDRTFEEIFDQARHLEQDLLDRAARLRTEGLGALAARCALFAELVAPDPSLDDQLRELRQEQPDTPRDHEDWCDLLKDANAAFEARVKRSENALLAQLSAHLAASRQRLEALAPIPRLDERDAQLARLRETFDALADAGQGGDALTLLNQVEEARALGADLAALEAGIREDQAGLEAERAALRTRAAWLAERSAALAIPLPEATPEPATPEPAPQADPDPRSTSLEGERSFLAQQARDLAAAEARFGQACGEALAAASQRLAQVLAVLSPDRYRASALDLAPDPAPAPVGGDLGGIAAALGRVQTQVAAAESLLAEEALAQTARAAALQQALAAVPPEGLGHNDRGDREALLRQLQQWRPDALADPVARLRALAELCEGAEHLQRRIESAARRLHERREALRERLRRFNGGFLQGYCPDLYVRVEALTHPPAQTHWPRGAEERQLQEAERLLALLERQAHRLAAREIGEHLQVLARHARRFQDDETQALVEEVQALPPEQPPSARLRRRLADQRLALGLDGP